MGQDLPGMTSSVFLPYQGPSVILRPFEAEDASVFHQYINHPELAGRRCLPWEFSDIIPLSRKQAEAVINHWVEAKDEVNLAVVRRQDQQLIGHAGCDWGWDTHCPGVTVVIAPEYQRRRYGSEVLQILLHHLFGNSPAHVVECWVADWNLAGRFFLKGHGFQESGRMRRAGIRRGGYFDLVITDLLRQEWMEQQEESNHAA